MPREPGQFGDKIRCVHRAEARRQVVARPGGEALDRVLLVVLGERHRVVPLGHVRDAGLARGGQPVQGRVDQPQGVARHLVGQGHDPGEQRGGLAGAALRGPAGRRPGEGGIRDHGPVAGRAHRDVRHAAAAARHVAHALLVGRPGEEDGQPAAAGQRVGTGVAVGELVRLGVVRVVPRGGGGRGALRGEVQLGPADRGHQGVAVRPRGDPERVVGGLVQPHVGGTRVAGRGQHRDVVFLASS